MNNNEAFMIPRGKLFYFDHEEMPHLQTHTMKLTDESEDDPMERNWFYEVHLRKRAADEITLKSNLETGSRLLRRDLAACCSKIDTPELAKSVIASHLKCLQICCIPLYTRLCSMQYLEQLVHNSFDELHTAKKYGDFLNVDKALTSAWSWAVEQYYQRQELLQNNLIKIIEDSEKTWDEICDQVVAVICRSYTSLSDTAYQMKIQGQLECISLTGRDSYTYICNHSDTSCSRCASLHQKVFTIKDSMTGVNLPPIHPNCRCEIQGYPALPEDTSAFDIVDLIGWEVFNRSVDSACELLEIPLDFLFDGISELWKFGFMDGLQDSYGAYGNLEIDGTQYAWNEHTFSAVVVDPTGVIIKPENLLQYDAVMLELMRQRDEMLDGSSNRKLVEGKIEELNSKTDKNSLSVRSYLPYDYYVLGTDITDRLNTFMKKIRNEYTYMHQRTWMENLLEFKRLVQNKGDLDLKNQPEWQHSAFIYDGELVDQDALGNINYGFFGAYCNIPDSVLMIGGGYAQIQAGTQELSFWTTLFDDPRDTFRVLQGIELYRLWYE